VRLPSPIFSGPQKAGLFLEIDSSNLPPGRHEATVQVIGNAGKTLPLQISVEVLRPPAPPPRLRQPSSMGRALLKGALLGMVLRLLLVGPADLYARVIAVGGQGQPLPGTFAAWREAPVDAAFVKHFVLATWWIGAVAGVVLLARRRSHWADVPCGLIAGAALGLAASGTVACLLPALDGPARLLLQPVASAASSVRGAAAVFAGTVGWLAVAVLSWAVLGALATFALRIVSGAPKA
jgi:hypothetical protein